MNYNGILNVYKEDGFTSHDVVAKLKGILKQKKIGHTGTLDPKAVGVLIICLGSGTRLAAFLNEKDKEYIATLRLGLTSDTQDIFGLLSDEQDVNVTKEAVQEALLSFRGTYPQIPPMYSAIKIGGKKLYDLARAGQEIERKPRNVEIKELEILKLDLPEVKFRLVCSKGTYVRTICHDVGAKLGCGGVMAALERTRAGEFLKKDALTLSQIEELCRLGQIENKILPNDTIFKHLKKISVPEAMMKPVKNGNSIALNKLSLKPILIDGEKVRLYDDNNVFYALYTYSQNENLLKPFRMFL